MNLYQIEKELAALIDPETGEITDFEALDALSMERERKVDAIICLIKNRTAEAAACSAEAANFTARAKSAKAEAQRLTNYLGGFLDYTKTDSPHGSVSFRKTYAVEADESLVPVEFMVKHEEYTPDKKAIMARLKAGEAIPGCSIRESHSIVIK